MDLACGVRARWSTRPFQCGHGSAPLRSAVTAKSLKSCKLVGVGSSAPSTILTNDDLATYLDTNDEWISTRTGIRRRHVLSQGESITDHAISSARSALDMAGIDAKDVDMIIMSTSSPDDLFGSATQVQAALGASSAIAFDLTAACSGFVMGLITAAQFVRTGVCKNVLIIGADALSRYIDWNDRGTCILFGDGAGACVVTAHDGPCSMLGLDMNSDGSGFCNLNAPFDAKHSGKPLDLERRSNTVPFNNLYMNGQEVFKFAVRSVPGTLKKSLQASGLSIDEVDWLVMHQANQRILDAAAKKVGLPADKVISNLAEYGNTSAASIPLALDEAVRNGIIKDGDVLAMAGFGAGLTWASAIVRWR